MISGYQESVFFHYILSNPIFLNVAKAEFFTNPVVRELFEVAKEHAIRYKEPPLKEQLSELVRIKGLGEKISEDIITALYNSKVELQQYDSQWLEENVGPWIRARNLETVMRKAIAFMKTTAFSAENAAEVVEKVRHMISSETAIDFSFHIGSDFFDPEVHQQTRLARTSTGYPFMDKCLDGGWWKGALIVFLGAAKSGKCVEKNTNIKVRNKQTGEIIDMTINQLHNKIKKYNSLSSPEDI
jgi:hypothetical protein